MKHFLLLALVLSALSACAGGTNRSSVDAQCPSDRSQTLTRQQWEACYGRQENDQD